MQLLVDELPQLTEDGEVGAPPQPEAGGEQQPRPELVLAVLGLQLLQRRPKDGLRVRVPLGGQLGGAGRRAEQRREVEEQPGLRPPEPFEVVINIREPPDMMSASKGGRGVMENRT